jgi:hypothetical protein
MTGISTNSAVPIAPLTRPEAGDWENEGGALADQPHVPVLPDGIVAVTETYYRVGRYTYLALAEALAEHQRQMSCEEIP